MTHLHLPLNLDFNDQFARAFHLMESTNKNIFITGKAGTGKSTLLQYFRSNTKKNIVVLAPTGVAAVNIKGQTIHSFFNFKTDITPDNAGTINPRNKKVYKNIDAVVIDEISMVRADLLDCIDIFLRRFGKKKKQAFGGTQMIFIGDLYQLPPVVTYREKDIFKSHYKSPYFFDAKVFGEHSAWLNAQSGNGKADSSQLLKSSTFDMDFIELEKVYRQTDEHFIHLLNKIRNNTVDGDDLSALNKRSKVNLPKGDGDFYVHLTTTNDLADAINHDRLMSIPGKTHKYEGLVDGNFQAKDLPTHQALTVKIGAQVMLLNNHPDGLWINGSIGRILEIEKDEAGRDIIAVELSDGDIVYVTPFTWEMFRFYFDDKNKTIESESVGSFTQYPLKLSWAVTIHKSQGKTFDKVVIDIGRGTFSHGQMYVALSRCTTLEGIILKKPIEKNHIMMDWRVVNFITGYQYNIAHKQCSINDKICIIQEAVKNRTPLEILYLKAKDEKSRRTIVPLYVGEMDYLGKKYIGIRAYCQSRKEDRIFRVDRILEINNTVGCLDA